MSGKDTYRQLCLNEASIPLFSRDWWLDIVCEKRGWEILFIEDNDRRIVATMPYFMPSKGVIYMPPFTQTLGIWFSSSEKPLPYHSELYRKQQLCKQIIEKIPPFHYFCQNFHHTYTDWLPFYWAGYQQSTRYSYLLNDLSDTNSLWEGMSKQTHRNITKARESGIIIKQNISIDAFIEIYSKTFQRQGVSVPHTTLLKRLIARCQELNQGDIWGGYDSKGELHAVAFIAWDEQTAYYIAGGSDPTLRASGAHSLVLWEGIQEMGKRCRRFDFEGSMLPGVERFFREFGATQTPFFTISKGNLSLLDRGWIKLKKLLQ